MLDLLIGVAIGGGMCAVALGLTRVARSLERADRVDDPDAPGRPPSYLWPEEVEDLDLFRNPDLLDARQEDPGRLSDRRGSTQ